VTLVLVSGFDKLPGLARQGRQPDRLEQILMVATKQKQKASSRKVFSNEETFLFAGCILTLGQRGEKMGENDEVSP